MAKNSNIEELSDDMEVVGPGQMLAEARQKLGLSQKDVAERLNFRTTLVKELEQDIFDKSLPATFNRGYLKNYAKLVDISAEEVLASYETISVAEMQGAEMQSFSKQTEKQAENNRLMWVTYLIIALLIGSTLMWWLQESKNSDNEVSEPINVNQTKPSEQTSANQIQENVSTEADLSDTEQLSDNLGDDIAADTELVNEGTEDAAQALSNENNNQQALESIPLDAQISSVIESDAVEQSNLAAQENSTTLVDVSFTFSGDCWVNIYDATGERIAWGIKKSGYQMNIQGVPPFSITLGKPELVTIVYNEQSVDTSSFAKGNIAKFNLPMTDE